MLYTKLLTDTGHRAIRIAYSEHFVLRWDKNTAEEEEIAPYEQILIFPPCFQNSIHVKYGCLIFSESWIFFFSICVAFVITD